MKSKQHYLDIVRQDAGYLSPQERLTNFNEFALQLTLDELYEQASRCMECGVPFCHNVGCPLGNPIPEFNELVATENWKLASDLLHSTNNFPEWTGRLCPALCEASCVHRINGSAVTIKQLELAIVEYAWRQDWIKPILSPISTGKRVAVVGSGPAGLAAAQQLVRAGHEVVVYERDSAPGGILRFGIPDFKLEKYRIDRRLNQMKAEGVRFEVNVEIGTDISPKYLRRHFDAVCLTGGAMEPRDCLVPGRSADGIYFAMEYLIAGNRAVHEGRRSTIDAKGKNVVIIGGGDTGADCLGTALRQGASHVEQIEIMPKPPERENPLTPWPQWPNILRTGTSHGEGGNRRWTVNTKSFRVENSRVIGLDCVSVDWKNGKPEEISGSGFSLNADLVLLALGFVHPKYDALLEQFGVALDQRGNVRVDPLTSMTNTTGIFSAGDMQTGASLVVRAIDGGRRMAFHVDNYLLKSSSLPFMPKGLK
ncbi:MAG: glutamate synthase subunit beta [Planctomycetaceae bacterium]|jgi:glutamate synthase (NADPH/NADH) small chain|nr:glutamate synthase subunit beta [Planctomycetaceae bacterium]